MNYIVPALHPQIVQQIVQQIVDGQSQTDPQFRNNRLYTRLTSGAVRQQLIAQKGYADSDLPGVEAIRQRLNRLGYYPKKVKKSLPKKDSPSSSALFECPLRVPSSRT